MRAKREVCILYAYFTNAALAAASSFSLLGPTSGYLRWSESNVWMIAATTRRVNHLLSAISN